jgi:hypothetical protein
MERPSQLRIPLSVPTGRVKLIFRAMVATIRPGSKVDQTAAVIVVSRIVERIPPWTVPKGLLRQSRGSNS